MGETKLLTYADLLMFPEDGMRRELLDGELIVSASPNLRHQRIASFLHVRLGGWVEEHGGGEVFIAPLDVLLSDSDVVKPDLFFVPDDRAETLTEANVKGVPSLVIEVLSNARVDRVRKRDAYERFGVPEYWIVDPDSDRIEVCRLQGGSYAKPEIIEPGEELRTALLPGFALDVTAVFNR